MFGNPSKQTLHHNIKARILYHVYCEGGCQQVYTMPLNPEVVTKIAQLAYIEITPEEKEQLIKELSSILEFIHKLNEIDTHNVTPLVSVVDRTLPHRQDVVTEQNKPQDILRNTPSCQKNYFVVPKIIDS